MTIEEFRTSMNLLAEALAAQANREVAAPMHPYMGTTTTRVREFPNMNLIYSLLQMSRYSKFMNELLEKKRGINVSTL